MAVSSYLFEGATDGATQTTANTGGSQVTVATGGSATFAAAAAVDGSLGGRWVGGTPTAAATFTRFSGPSSSMTYTTELDFCVPVLPTGTEVRVFQMRSSTASIWTLRVYADGHLSIVNPASVAWVVAPAGTITAGGWYRVSITTTSATASTGTFTARLYRKFGRLPVVAPVTFSGIDLGTAANAAVDVGVVNPGGAAAFVVLADNLRISDGSAEIGPVSHGAATTSAGWVSDATDTTLRGAWLAGGDYGALTIEATAAGHTTRTGTATAAVYGWVTGEVTGLDSDVVYTLTLKSGGVAISGSGITGRTLATARKAFKAATGSCHTDSSNPALFATLQGRSPDFFVHQGDMTYVDTSNEIVWRNSMQNALAKSNLKALVGAVGMRWAPDNHDTNGPDTDKTWPWATWGPTVVSEWTGRTELYEAWSHGGVLFIHLDMWTFRDILDTAHGGLPNDDATKRMLGSVQETWFKNLVTNATEDFVIIFPHFPLYATRFNNYQVETARLKAFFDALPAAQRAKCIAIGGDSHDVRATTLSSKSVWGIPTLNASPFSMTGGGAGFDNNPADWDVAIISPTPDNPAQYASEIEFSDVASGQRTFTWRAINPAGTAVASWSRTVDVPSDAPPVFVADSGGTPVQVTGVFVADGTGTPVAVSTITIA